MESHLHSQTNPRLNEINGPLVITHGDGCLIRDEHGNDYLEGMGGLWCASLGFANAEIGKVAAEQLGKLATYHTFNHRSNDACAELVGLIAQLSPLPQSRVFLANSGSEANDTMAKLAWYYQVARGKTDKRKIISRKGAFHGSTVMGAALSGLPHMHRSFNLPDVNVVFADFPHFYREAEPNETEAAFTRRLLRNLEAQILNEGPETIAAMIMEPVMGAGGVIVPPDGYFGGVQEILRRHDILMLSDEVVCGFGRTGEWFGCQAFGFVPDMMSIAKGLSSGYLPVAAAVLSGPVYEVIADEADRLGVLGHGFTYSGHPVTAAVAAAVLRTYQQIDAPRQAGILGARLHERLRKRLGNHPMVGEIRGKGFIAGIELVADRQGRKGFDPAAGVGSKVERACRSRGALIRNMGDVIAICPPLIMTEDQVDILVERVAQAIDDVTSEIQGNGQHA